MGDKSHKLCAEVKKFDFNKDSWFSEMGLCLVTSVKKILKSKLDISVSTLVVSEILKS